MQTATTNTSRVNTETYLICFSMYVFIVRETLQIYIHEMETNLSIFLFLDMLLSVGIIFREDKWRMAAG